MDLFTIIWICWVLSEFLLNRIFRSDMSNSKELDKNSWRVIWLTIGISITLGVLCKKFIDIPIAGSIYIGYLGLSFLICGMIIRFIAIYTLGKFFTVDLAIKEDHKLVKNGLYKYIRHPAYSGSLLSFLGLGLSMNNWLSMIVIFVPVLLAFSNRIRIEEKLLLDQIGLEYGAYMKNTKRLVPFIY
jgi:protein-S-isoprenylcysteine O-methyltransferase Ste14